MGTLVSEVGPLGYISLYLPVSPYISLVSEVDPLTLTLTLTLTLSRSTRRALRPAPR